MKISFRQQNKDKAGDKKQGKGKNNGSKAAEGAPQQQQQVEPQQENQNGDAKQQDHPRQDQQPQPQQHQVQQEVQPQETDVTRNGEQEQPSTTSRAPDEGGGTQGGGTELSEQGPPAKRARVDAEGLVTSPVSPTDGGVAAAACPPEGEWVTCIICIPRKRVHE